MYPRLSDLIKDIFGVNIPLPIQSYGFMFALAFVFGTLIYAAEYRRKEKEGKLLPVYIEEKIGFPPTFWESFWTFFWSFIIGFKGIYAISHYSDFVANPQGFLLSLDGSFIGGLIVAIGLTAYYIWKKNKEKLPEPKIERVKTYPHQLVGNMVVVVGIWGLVGAKVFDAIQPQNFNEFIHHPLRELLSFSGLTFYGGIIVGFIAGILYLKKYNINLLQSIDSFAPAAALAYSIGRIGCQISGDGCWGIINTHPKPKWLSFLPDWAWSFDYPHNVLGANAASPEWGIHVEHIANCTGTYCYKLAEGVYPTPFYETTIMFIVFLILWGLRKKIKIPGIIFSIYLILAGLERFFVEFIRITHRYNFLGFHLSQAQIISLFMIIGGIAMIIYIMLKKDYFIELGTPKEQEINQKQRK